MPAKKKIAYDSYYQTENLFGDPYPELISYFKNLPQKGNILDLGCGQGRDAVSLARMGFKVVGVDHSKLGIEQMEKIAKDEKLALKGIVADIYEFDQFSGYDFILLDSMFHFNKKDLKKETDLIKNIIQRSDTKCLIVMCIQNTGKKVDILNETLDFQKKLNRVYLTELVYEFKDQESGHVSKSNYWMVVVGK